jgi:hypothetical protein
MTIDLDALEALEKKAMHGVTFSYEDFRNVFNALPELIRLARIGQRVERDAKRPDPMSQYLNEGDGVYRP